MERFWLMARVKKDAFSLLVAVPGRCSPRLCDFNDSDLIYLRRFRGNFLLSNIC